MPPSPLLFKVRPSPGHDATEPGAAYSPACAAEGCRALAYAPRAQSLWSSAVPPAVPSPPVPPHAHGYRWAMLGGVWLIYFGFGLLSLAMAPLVDPISRDLGLSYTTMGAILGRLAAGLHRGRRALRRLRRPRRPQVVAVPWPP